MRGGVRDISKPQRPSVNFFSFPPSQHFNLFCLSFPKWLPGVRAGFSLPLSFFFLPSGNADGSICGKCPCVFEFQRRYLTSASASWSSSNAGDRCLEFPPRRLQTSAISSFSAPFKDLNEPTFDKSERRAVALTWTVQIVSFISGMRCLSFI